MTTPRIKITVERKVDVRDLWGDDHPATVDDFPPVCPFYNVGDEFIIDQVKLPEGFCVSAFSDLYRYIFALRTGSNFSWMKKEGEVLACCTDAFRPVVFKIERIEE